MRRPSDPGGGTAGGAPAHVRRRPKDRRQQIIGAAAEQFARSGFHDVSMAAVARAVGITASAVYRHFEDKQALLEAVIVVAVDSFDEALAASAGSQQLLRDAAAIAIEHRDVNTLWQRETRYLTDESQRRIRHRLRQSHARLVAALGEVEPGLSAADLDLLGWAVSAVHTSVAHHRIQLPHQRLPRILSAIGRNLAAAINDTPDGGEVELLEAAGSRAGILLPASRREALLAVAAPLIHERGFRAVSHEDLGNAAGITGPSVYKHFESKDEILETLVDRATSTLLVFLHRDIRMAASAQDALDRHLASYTQLVHEHTSLYALIETDALHLTGTARSKLKRLRQEYRTEWVTLLRASRPELTPKDAQVLVHAALTIINDLSRTKHLRRGPLLTGRLVTLAQASLATSVP
jgi:AcrR family transcriptional regulator